MGIATTRTALLMSVCSMVLSGCDLMTEFGEKVRALAGNYDDKPITLVIAPGYRINIVGRPVPVFGFDKCPQPDEAMAKLFGAESLTEEDNCTVIKPDAKSVEVTVGLPDGPVREKWSVERNGDRTSLRRPDGLLVVPAI